MTANDNETKNFTTNGSITHQIIGKFLIALEESRGYEEIAQKLKNVVLEGKINDGDLRKAMFGEDPL